MKKNKFNISRMTLEDVVEAKKLIAQSWLETYRNDEFGVTKEFIEKRNADSMTDEAIKRTTDRLGYSGVASWVAKDEDGKIVGAAIQYIAEKDGKQHIMALYIDRDYHGKGVANTMMKNILEWFDKNKPVTLGVAVYNNRAKAFYKKWGFKEIIGSEDLFMDVIPQIQMIREEEK
ncbi:MAG: GNAT family N-acetyltransferase [Candidatus Nomurabacteria bacterium]|nr:MAG: GNAT family N-acetyltransferase [Candidatus Nomurabacteria bacterium]HRV75760.1 GNAT family N-acetyltransferase [Candidatus Saccharimonadales bacterium]